MVMDLLDVTLEVLLDEIKGFRKQIDEECVFEGLLDKNML